MRQKGESQNGRFKKTKHTKFSEKQTVITPDTHTYVIAYPVFIPYYRQILGMKTISAMVLNWKQ